MTVNKLAFLCVMLITCKAEGDPPLIPVGGTSLAPYSNAVNSAQRAFMMQVGFTQEYNKDCDMFTVWGTKEGYKIVDDYTPVSRQTATKIFGLGFACYTVYQKQVQASFDNPFFKNVKHDITVNPQGGTLNIRIPL